jgi:anti-sigma factor RsiW
MTTCSGIQPHLSDYADGALAPDDRAAVEAHLAICPACRDAGRDFERLRDAAGALGPIGPPPHVWQRISGSLPSKRRQARAQWLGLAAALVLITAGAYFFARATAPATPSRTNADTAGNAANTATVETVEQELATAAKHYEAAIAQLEAVARQDTSTLPPDAAARLQVSLTQIDKYIAESRAALVNEPQSEPARDSLFSALRRKVSILQDTVALMGAMQRGDPEAAAKIIGGKS